MYTALQPLWDLMPWIVMGMLDGHQEWFLFKLTSKYSEKLGISCLNYLLVMLAKMLIDLFQLEFASL